MPTTASPHPTVPIDLYWHQARHFVGTRARVSGRIEAVFNNGKAVQLAFAEPHRGHFKILIEQAHWPSFGSALDTTRGANRAGRYRVGQHLTVEGVIGWYQGDPVIRATHPDQIRVDVD
jgi:hypothetical protein